MPIGDQHRDDAKGHCEYEKVLPKSKAPNDRQETNKRDQRDQLRDTPPPSCFDGLNVAVGFEDQQ